MNTSNFLIQDGILDVATFYKSPNFNARPEGKNGTVQAIVIHNISLPPNEFGARDETGMPYITSFFMNTLDWQIHPYFKMIEGSEVSAHFVIFHDGQIHQFVNCNHRAWHAGKSSYLGRDNVNDFSIGIELEGADTIAYTDEQYDALARLILAIYQAYPKTQRHLMGHSDIAPIRKTDPGKAFDWVRLRTLLRTIKQS